MIDEDLLRESNKDCDPKGFYFETPSSYLENYRYLKEGIDESRTLNQRYGGKMKGVESSELEKRSQFEKIYRRRLKDKYFALYAKNF